MKLKILILFITIGLCLTGCNYDDLADTTSTFNKAIINLTNGEVVTVDVKSWKGYSYGDKIEITAKDGTTYLVHSSNCTLIKD